MAALSSGLVFAAGCGDDDGDMNPVADSGTEPDAADEPDAGEEPAGHGGSLAITEVTITDLEAPVPLSGASKSIGWVDLDTVTVPPVDGFESTPPGCTITIYDVSAGEEPAPATDEGVITVTGTASGEFACAFSDGEYRCQSTDEAAAGAIAAGSAIVPNAGGAGTALYTFEGADFTGATYAGMWIEVAGFTEDANNGSFPILAQQGADGLILGNPAATVEPPLEEPGTYATAAAAGPIPNGFDFLPAGEEITITKPASDFIPEIDQTFEPAGDGFTLDEQAGALPHEVPTNCTAVTFACPGDDCGAEGTGQIKGMVISGSTTDADIEGLDFNEMPDATGQYATFQCFALNATSAELSADAMRVILGTNPTRIQFNVSYLAAFLLGDTNVASGHTLTGFTDVVDTTGCDE